MDYEPFYTVNVTAGSNEIPLSASTLAGKRSRKPRSSVVRINVEGWQNNRINLDSIVLNKVCTSWIHYVYTGMDDLFEPAWTFFRVRICYPTRRPSWRSSLSETPSQL